jgi:hypothetical protein
MELVRNLPTSDAAQLARPAIDLAVGHDLMPEAAGGVMDLAGELLAESTPRVESDTIELRVVSGGGSVRVEVTWTGTPPGSDDDPDQARHSKAIDRLSDRWGSATDGAHHRLWAERSARPRSA